MTINKCKSCDHLVSVISACENVMKHTDHKPINAHEMAELIIKLNEKLMEAETDRDWALSKLGEVKK